MPYRLTIALQGSQADVTTIERLELNVPVDEAEFRKPQAGALQDDP